MAQLAIKGHETRGSEVIALLEMLGGINSNNLYGDENYAYYTIDNDKEIKGGIYVFGDEELLSFTLEEFLEKFPYKIGNRVKVKETGKDVTIDGMSWRNGREVIYDTCYKNDCVAFYSAEELQPYKEEAMDKANKAVFDANAQCCDIINHLIKEESMEEIIKIDIPKGYEFAGVDDDNQQVVFEKIGCQYPKTYEQCCDVLNIDVSRTIEHSEDCPFYKDITCYEYDLLSRLAYLRKLFVCREAYWKIAGEQMGLGKPWKPDWKNSEERRYCIVNIGGDINLPEKILTKWILKVTNKILVFPYEEMRDAFYENFKDLINETKELL